MYSDELRLSNVEKIGILENEIERVLLKKGDLLVVEGNGSQDQIGRAVLWDGSIDPCVHQNHIIKVRFHNPDVGRYAMLWLLSSNGRELIKKVASSTSGLYTLSISKVAALPIVLPSIDEQNMINAEVERRLSIVNSMEKVFEQSSKRIINLRQSILQRAFSGQLIN